MKSRNEYDLIIVGGGAAGYAAALYAKRYELSVLLIEGETPGGETANAGLIENYPGFEAIDGYELYQKFRNHALKFGAEVQPGRVEKVTQEGHQFKVSVVGQGVREGSCIIFTHGQARRRLGLPNEERLTGKGVSYCVTCYGPLYKGKTVGIVGGGDASVKGVNLLTEFAHKVFLIVKLEQVNAEPINYRLMQSKSDKVETLYHTQVKEMLEENGKFIGVKLFPGYQGNDILKLDGLFIEIGAVPDRALPASLGVALTESGHIHVDQFMQTNIAGVFAAGDVTDATGSFRQIVTAAAQGSMAATSAYEYIRKNTVPSEQYEMSAQFGNTKVQSSNVK